jgi:hypothetical protein
MLRAKSLLMAAAMPVLAAVCSIAPALAVECGPDGCSGFYVVHPQPSANEHHQYMTHGPDHDYTPMAFYDGHGGYTDGQWYWGGLTWRYGQPRYRGPFRADGW